ncbi:hypothetical protein D3C84_793030 [compost metagenome]
MPDQVRQDWQRVQARRVLSAITQGQIPGATHLVTDREAISEEQKVEQPLLHDFRNARVVLGLKVIADGFRVTPRRVAVDDRTGQQEG